MLLIGLLTLLFVTSSYQQCNTPIIRDFIQGGNGKADFLVSLGEDAVLPLLNESVALELSIGGTDSLTSPIFKLNTSYIITAVDIQFGTDGGSTICRDTADIVDMAVIMIGDIEPLTVQTANDPIQIGYGDNDRMNLLELGDPNDDRIVRFKINPTQGRFVQYRVSCNDKFT